MKNFILTLFIFMFSKAISQQYPKSLPNGGTLGAGLKWTSNQYIEKAIEDSINAVNIRNNNLERADSNKNFNIDNFKKQKLNKKEFAEIINKVNLNYEKTVADINLSFEDKIIRIRDYRDEWVKYLKYESEETDRKLAADEADEEARIKENIEKQKNDRLKFEEEKKKYENIGNSLEYKKWKTKYLNLMQSALVNVNTCNSIIKKHTYLNRLHEKKYNSDSFTKQEKILFNKNLDLLENKIKQISELEENRDLYLYFIDNGTIRETTGAYNLSYYLNTTNRCY